MKRSELTLFYSIWGILVLGLLIWKFQSNEIAPSYPGPTVNLRPELAAWFTRGRVLHSGTSQYRIELDIAPGIQASMTTEDRALHIDYHFVVDKNERDAGSILLKIPRGSAQIQIQLPNPKRISAKEIWLALSH